jgi:hypothetical protein
MSITGVRSRRSSVGRPGIIAQSLSARRFRINLSVIFRIDQGE